MKKKKDGGAAVGAVHPFYINRGVRPWHEFPTAFHTQDAVKVVVALRGSFCTETHKAQFEVAALSAIVLPPQLQHRFFGQTEPVEMLVITFPYLTAKWTSLLMSKGKPRVIFLHTQDMSALEDLHWRCQQEEFRDDKFAQTALEGFAQAWLTVLVRAASRPVPSPGDKRVHDVRKVILGRFREPLRIRALAKQAAMSESHFRERYRTVFGCSPKTEIIRLRIRKAQELLLSTELTLAEIAAECGFCNEHEFSHVFHKYSGMPPGSWRKQG
ncbi:MAG: AraC family transcriptional regulator [Chthoniobacterales bacterium]